MSLPAPYSEVYLEGTGSRVEFPFGTNFKPISSGLVKCVVYLSDGNHVVPTYTVDMSVGSITISALTLPNGTILSAPPADSVVRIYRDEPEAQNATASQLQAFTAKQLETSLDAIVAMIQEVSYTVDHKAVRLTEPQRDIILQQLLEADDDSLIYWDNDARKLVTTNYKHQDVVQCAGGLFFRLKTNTVTHNPYLQWSTDGSDWHSMDFDSIDVIATEAKQIAQDAKDVADEAKGIADDAKDIAQDAMDLANTFDGRITTIENNTYLRGYTHDQAEAASTWVVEHNLNRYPSIMVVDSAGSRVDYAAKYINSNTCELYFNAPFTGTAYLN